MGRHTMYRNASVEEYLKRAALHVEVLNHALRNVAADRVRMHICWGNYEGPHHHDVPLEQLLPVVIKAKPQALLFEAANPRHAHEWAVFREQRDAGRQDPDPGRAQLDDQLRRAPAAGRRAHLPFRRHRRAASACIAGTDCGFGTFAGFGPVDPDIVVHEARGDGRRRAHRQQAPVGGTRLRCKHAE